MLEWIRFGFTALFLLCGTVTMFFAVFGTYRFRFALNRIHSAAMNDTLGLSLFLIGLSVSSDSFPLILKFILTVVFAWSTGAVTSHMLAKLEYMTDAHLSEHCSLPNKNEHSEDGTK